MINLYLILYFSADLGEETFAEPLQLSPVRPATTAMYSLVKEDDPEVKHQSLAAQEQGTKRIIRPAAIRQLYVPRTMTEINSVGSRMCPLDIPPDGLWVFRPGFPLLLPTGGRTGQLV